MTPQPLFPIEWKTSQELVDYPDAMEAMEQRVAHILAGQESELVWLLQHPPLYTAGTGAKPGDLLDKQRFPVYEAGRGGQYTYHGPGQRIAYVMMDLKRRNAMDLRAYVKQLEAWIIATLAQFGIEGFIREGRVGVWVNTPSLTLPRKREREYNCPEAKIAAIGVRVKQWVTYHGISINVEPNLSHYAGIVPCGINEHGVTSFKALGIDASLAEVDAALQTLFTGVFV